MYIPAAGQSPHSAAGSWTTSAPFWRSARAHLPSLPLRIRSSSGLNVPLNPDAAICKNLSDSPDSAIHAVKYPRVFVRTSQARLISISGSFSRTMIWFTFRIALRTALRCLTLSSARLRTVGLCSVCLGFFNSDFCLFTFLRADSSSSISSFFVFLSFFICCFLLFGVLFQTHR